METGSAFTIEQTTQADGAIRLRLVGELDLAVVPNLTSRLAQLKGEQRSVQLDLSNLRFMDSTGLGTVITAVLDARRDGWSLEIHRSLARPVQRIVDFAGAGPYLWPEPAV